jgi:dienelactone hydrolase
MHHKRTCLLVACLTALLGCLTPAAAQQVKTEQLSFDSNPGRGSRPAKVTATLYLPKSAGPVPAMVLTSSSGGVLDWIEGYYARALSREGIAALVIDSFRPRGVRNVISSQSAVSSWDMENDAFAALALLGQDKRIDASRIGIMGLSKGGIVAQNSAFLIRRQARGTGALAFALHVPIAPDCTAQFRDTQTTRKPMFYMLAELDDADPSTPCVEYAHRIKVSGNSDVSVKVYKGAHHAWEMTKPVVWDTKAQNFSKCTRLIEDNGDRTFAAGNLRVKSEDEFAWMVKNCMTMGEHVGGGTEKHKKEATDDLIAFLRKNGF